MPSLPHRPHPSAGRRARRRGFTLIEVMVTMLIIGILAAVALPLYSQYVVKAKRRAAQAQMQDLANREAQYMLANRAYADKSTLENNGYTLAAEVAANYGYDVTLGTTDAPTYLITFTPSGSQASDQELTLDSAGVKAPAAKW